MAENVRFKTASQAKYDALENKNAATLYWCLDTQRLYKGDKLFGVGLEATQQFAGLLSAEDKKKLDALVSGSIAGLEAVDGTMSITDGDAGVKKLGVNVSKEAGNLIAVKADGLFVHVDVPEYTFIQEETPIGDNFATYTLRKTLDGLSEDCGHINIPKDKFLQSATVEVVAVADQPYAGAIVGEKYLDLVFNDAESSHVYVPLKDLAGKTYTAGTGIEISDTNVISMKMATATEPGAISAENFKLLQAIPQTYLTKEEGTTLKEEIKSEVKKDVGTPDASQFKIDENGVMSIDNLDTDKIIYRGKKLTEYLDGVEESYTWDDIPETISATTAQAATAITQASDGAEVTIGEGSVADKLNINKSVSVAGTNKGVAQNHNQEVTG